MTRFYHELRIRRLAKVFPEKPIEEIRRDYYNYMKYGSDCLVDDSRAGLPDGGHSLRIIVEVEEGLPRRFERFKKKLRAK